MSRSPPFLDARNEIISDSTEEIHSTRENRHIHDMSDPVAYSKLNQRLSVVAASTSSATNLAAPTDIRNNNSNSISKQFHNINNNNIHTNKKDSESSNMEQLSFLKVATTLFKSTFGFNKIPFSFFFIVTYLAIIILITPVQNSPPPVLSVYPEKFLLRSWTDLQEISREFHPYSSHANDRVHDYILSQVRTIARQSQSSALISTRDDTRKFLFEEADVFNPDIQGRVVYFEGNNILVKVQGNDTSLGAVLVSAHFDSVPTAYGTTDDGAGIASMLGILRYYADEKTPPPQRSIIFNFNNNEEFGLLGAQAFFEHPWSKEVEVFLNLEGTGAGGRAILFRSTDYGVAKHYRAASAPHMNSIFQQGFTDGYIRSETDYKVYTSKGLRGLDVAFYKPRNLYHTRRDSIRGTTFGSLSHMFTNALDVVRSMSSADENDYTKNQEDLERAVYFDVLGQYAIVLPLHKVFQLQVIGLISGPIILIVLLLIVLRTKSWKIGVRGWLRGIVSLFCSITATVMASRWIQKENQLIVISQFFPPLLLLLSIFIITNYLILGVAFYIYPVHDQKLVIFIETFVALWILMLFSTVHISTRGATGEYIIPLLYYLYLLAVVLGLLGQLFGVRDDLSLSKGELNQKGHINHYNESNERYRDEEAGSSEPLLGSQRTENNEHGEYGATNEEYNTDNAESDNSFSSDGDNADDSSNEGGEVESSGATQQQQQQELFRRDYGMRNDVSESISHSHEAHTMEDHKTTREKLQHIASKSLSFDWSIQFLIVVPIGVYLIYSSGLLTFNALRENAQEGASRASGVYYELTAIAVVLGILIVPFVHRLHILVPVVLLGTVVVCSYMTLSFPPLSHASPIKMRFIQTISLDDPDLSPTVSILSRQGLAYKVISDFPSVKNDILPITCRPYDEDGNEVCSYEGPRPWVIDGETREEAGNYTNWMNVTVLRTRKDKKLKFPPASIMTSSQKLDNYESMQLNNKKQDDDDGDFGPFTGEIYVQAKDSRVCTLTFNTTIYRSGDIYSSSPVRTVAIYHDSLKDALSNTPGNGSENSNPPPDILKFYKGINDLTVHRLNWTQEGYHIGFLWVPRWYESTEVNNTDLMDQSNFDSQELIQPPFINKVKYDFTNLKKQSSFRVNMNKQDEPSKADRRALGVHVTCYWGEYDAESVIQSIDKKYPSMATPSIGKPHLEVPLTPHKDKKPLDGNYELVRKVPALDEVLKYGPTWVSWTNWAAGLVAVEKYIEL